jgi:molecular chaperone GrpE (heat shock protein)
MSDDEEAEAESTDAVVDEAPTIEVEEEPRELTIEEKLTEAEGRAETAEKEIAYRDADIVNIRKRHSQERADLLRYGGQGLARRLISLLDDFDRAISSMPETTDDSIMEGINMIRQNLETALVADGAKMMEVNGQKYDPKIMEAITTIPASEEHAPNTVVQVLEPGWMLHDRVLRPARVIVTAVK